MNQQPKNEIIKQKIYEAFYELKSLCTKDLGYFINKEKYEKALEMYMDRDEDIDTLLEMIERDKNNVYQSYKEWEKKQKEDFISSLESTQVENDKLGITLNKQMIELMMICNAKNIEELKKIANDLILDIDYQNIDFNTLQVSVFNNYMRHLTDINKYYQNPNVNLETKKSNVIKFAHLNEEQILLINRIITESSNSTEVYKKIESYFPKDISDRIFIGLSESIDLSKPGIKQYEFEDFQLLYDKLKEFKSITIDFESKYPAIHLPNGKFYFGKLQRCLNFAKELDKDVRLNALIFFEDCPIELSSLEYNSKNKQFVFDILSNYVDQVTKYIEHFNKVCLQQKGKEVVKSIDVFNELITRFQQDFDGKYLNRENIKENFTESGWQKFLSVEDLCEIILIARKNLPNVEFVYNEMNLEDAKKIPAFKEVVDRIKTWEQKNEHRLNGKKIIDCIGTQMHLNPYVTEEQLDYSFSKISRLGLPIKITEYDQNLSDEFIKTHTHSECEQEKKSKQSTIKNFVKKNAKKYNIRQATIWSITDSTSFLLDNKNRKLIEQRKGKIKTLYSGAFREKRHFDFRTQSEVQIAEQIRLKNQVISQKKNPDKSKTLVKTNSNPISFNKGYINTIILALIISFTAGMLSMIVYFIFIK